MKKFVIIPRYSWPKGVVNKATAVLTEAAAESALASRRRAMANKHAYNSNNKSNSKSNYKSTMSARERLTQIGVSMGPKPSSPSSRFNAGASASKSISNGMSMSKGMSKSKSYSGGGSGRVNLGRSVLNTGAGASGALLPGYLRPKSY